MNVLFVCLLTLYGLSPCVVRFVPTNHRQLSLPSSALKSLEKVVLYKVASGKEQNTCKPMNWPLIGAGSISISDQLCDWRWVHYEAMSE